MDEARFFMADLRGVNAEGASLCKAYLLECSFVNGRLQGANLEAADMSGCDITQARLNGANLRGVQFCSREQICSAIIDRNTIFPSGITGIDQTELAGWPADKFIAEGFILNEE